MDQAWTVIWYLATEHCQVSDNIRRCDICGELFDSRAEGGYDEGGPPFYFCEDCDNQNSIEVDEEYEYE